jgi:adenylylsulfate kinase
MTSGIVIWVTGLPSSGKSSFGRRLTGSLGAIGVSACALDGDEVRSALTPALGYSDEERAAFYETLARLAALLARQGLCVVVPATAHRRAFRDRARELAPAFVEVWVDTPPEECARRDSKGLYARRAKGEATHLPGPGAEYEAPLEPDVIAHGGEDRRALEAVVRRVAAGRASEV